MLSFNNLCGCSEMIITLKKKYNKRLLFESFTMLNKLMKIKHLQIREMFTYLNI